MHYLDDQFLNDTDRDDFILEMVGTMVLASDRPTGVLRSLRRNVEVGSQAWQSMSGAGPGGPWTDFSAIIAAMNFFGREQVDVYDPNFWSNARIVTGNVLWDLKGFDGQASEGTITTAATESWHYMPRYRPGPTETFPFDALMIAGEHTVSSGTGRYATAAGTIKTRYALQCTDVAGTPTAPFVYNGGAIFNLTY